VSTPQLVVLWYAGLVVVAILLRKAMHASGPGYLISAIVTFASLLIYSLRPHPQARKRVVMLAVVPPLLLTLFLVWAVLAVPEYLQRQKERIIPNEQIELSDATLNERYGSVYLVGRIRNESALVLGRLEIEIRIQEDSKLVERHVTEVTKPVPPGEARQFENLLLRLETPVFKDANWDPRFTPHLRIVKAVGVAPPGQ
jgi:hypothetical protein